MPINKTNQDKIIPTDKGYHDTLFSVMKIKGGVGQASYKFFNSDEKTDSIAHLAKYNFNSGKNPLDTSSGILRAVWFTLHGVDNTQITLDVATLNELNKFINSASMEIRKQSKIKSRLNILNHVKQLPWIAGAAQNISLDSEQVEKHVLNLRMGSLSDSAEFELKFADGVGAYRPAAAIDGYLLKMHLDVFCYFEDTPAKRVSKPVVKPA